MKGIERFKTNVAQMLQKVENCRNPPKNVGEMLQINIQKPYIDRVVRRELCRIIMKKLEEAPVEAQQV